MGGYSSKPQPQKKAPGGTISSIDRAILDLKNSRDRLTRYQNKLQTDCDKLYQRASSEHAQAKASSKPTSPNTINLLKIRKFKLREVDSISSQLLTLEQMVHNIQTKEQEAQVITSLSAGKQTLAELQKSYPLDSVLELMDDISEQAEYEKEVSRIMGDVVGETGLSAEDLEQVEKELEEMEQALNAEKKADDDDDVHVELPVAPDTKPVITAADPVEKVPAKPERVAVAS